MESMVHTVETFCWKWEVTGRVSAREHYHTIWCEMIVVFDDINVSMGFRDNKTGNREAG